VRSFTLAVVLVAGCGRLAFETTSPGGDGSVTDGRFGPGADAALATTCGQPTASTTCDGFEGGIDVMWNQTTTNGTLTVDNTRAYRGTSSLHAHIDPVAPSSNVTNPHASLNGMAGLGTPVTGSVYLRTFIYLATPIDTTNYFLQILNAADDLGNGISAGTRHGKVTANDYTSILYGESAIALPTDRWTCLELEMPSNTAGTTRVYVDDIEMTDIAQPKQTTQPAPTHAYVGLTWVGDVTNQTAADAWIDEVQVDSQRIGCAR
jgi:hypothetical protein